MHLNVIKSNKFLISNKANINAKNKGGETPLDIAVGKETADILRNHNGTYGTFIGAVTAGDLNDNDVSAMGYRC